MPLFPLKGREFYFNNLGIVYYRCRELEDTSTYREIWVKCGNNYEFTHPDTYITFRIPKHLI